MRESYDRVAREYHARLGNELDSKPLDRRLLDAFARRVGAGAPVLDVGCGPGQIARYLERRGVSCLGIDLSTGMLQAARTAHTGMPVVAADMRRLPLATGVCAGAVAFYSLVHFSVDGVRAALVELRRVLSPDGVLLIAFHVGDMVLRRDALWGVPVTLDFRFFRVAAMGDCLAAAGLDLMETTIREPYPDVEHPSTRAYMFARKTT